MKPPGRRIAIVTACIAVGVLGLAGWLSWPSLRFWYLFAPLGKNAQGYREYRHRQTGIVFVRLPGGTFWMGAQAKDPNGQNYDPEAQENEGPVHQVTLSPFLIAKHEVTQGEWKSVMGSNPSKFRGDDRPVENVSWYDIQGFQTKTGLQLPKNAQWEYACRAGTSTPFAGNLEDMAWYKFNSGDTTHPIGEKKSNGFGLYDMHGNVFEWCEDVDPTTCHRYVRGGCWCLSSSLCRSAFFDISPPDYGFDVTGFRAAWRW